MILNHINLVVSDVAEAIKLFETYFDFECVNVKGDNSVAILNGSDGFTLVIMASKTGQPIYPAAFHIGFMLDSKEQVMKTYDALKKGGIEVGQKPSKIRDSFGFYLNFDGIMIEVGHYL
jgi:catechol-2,3-dioxygenase